MEADLRKFHSRGRFRLLGSLTHSINLRGKHLAVPVTDDRWQFLRKSKAKTEKYEVERFPTHSICYIESLIIKSDALSRGRSIKTQARHFAMRASFKSPNRTCLLPRCACRSPPQVFPKHQHYCGRRSTAPTLKTRNGQYILDCEVRNSCGASPSYPAELASVGIVYLEQSQCLSLWSTTLNSTSTTTKAADMLMALEPSNKRFQVVVKTTVEF